MSGVDCVEIGGQSKHRILVVEDDPVSRKMLVAALGRAGYDVDEAVDGQEAWELFSTNAKMPNAVITDVEMPRMDGLELSRKMREKVPSLPIALLTCRDDKETIKAALRCGVSEFMEKPASIAEVTRCAAELIETSTIPAEHERHKETVAAVRRAQSQLVGEAGEECVTCPIQFYNEPYKDAGGDIFRCTQQDDGSVFFVAGDVAGHSVESSYAVASFLGSFAAHSRKRGSIVNLLRHLNAEIRRGPFPGIPVCVLGGQWFPKNGWLHLANAGLPHPCLYEPRRRATRRIELDGTPLGMFDEPLIDHRTLTLSEGDRLLMGSDGLFDVTNEEAVPYEKHLCTLWGELSDGSLETALEESRQGVREWVDGLLTDDLLIVALEQSPKHPSTNELSLELSPQLDQIDGACVQMEKYLRSCEASKDLGDEGRFDILLATREALANAILHGSAGIAEARVVLRCWVEQLTLFISVTDEGEGVDLDGISPSDDDLREGGRGVPLMRALASELSSVPGELRLEFDLFGGSLGHG